MTYANTYYGFKPLNSGMRIIKKPCNCGGSCCNGRLGSEAHGVTNTNAAGERASAVTKFVNNTVQRTAGGQYLGTSTLVEVAKDLAKLPQNYLQYMTVPGITYTVAKGVWDLGKQSGETITQTINENPQIKQKVLDFTKKIVTSGKDIVDTVVNPIKGVSTTIAWLPYIVIGGLILLAIFAFKNPDTLKPGKVSVF